MRRGAGGRLGLGLGLAGLAGAALLIVADFSTLFGVRAVGADLQRVRGGSHHLYAMTAIAAVAIALDWRAAAYRRRLAMTGLILAGVLALIVFLAVDLPSLGSTAPFNQLYADTVAFTGIAIPLEVAGSVALVLSGFLQLQMSHRAARRPRR